jgi:cytochrome c553
VTISKQHGQAGAAALFAVLLLFCWSASADKQTKTGSDAGASSCADCHGKRRDNIPQLYSRSTHASAAISCTDCHGGDPAAADRRTAHGKQLLGRPDPNQTLAMCGSCHKTELEALKSSKHFTERRNAPRLDCAQCHGAHTVGAQPPNFSISYFCSGCHGLEYLPELRPDFQKLLAQTDDIRLKVYEIRQRGDSLPNDLEHRRKEIRRLTAEIVHHTDLKNSAARFERIMTLGEELKKKMGDH